MTVDKKADNTLEFHANFFKIFSADGLQSTKESCKNNGIILPENVAYERDFVHFKEENGNKYFFVTN